VGSNELSEALIYQVSQGFLQKQKQEISKENFSRATSKEKFFF
jgi:hypothetical protein